MRNIIYSCIIFLGKYDIVGFTEMRLNMLVMIMSSVTHIVLQSIQDLLLVTLEALLSQNKKGHWIMHISDHDVFSLCVTGNKSLRV